MLNDEEVAMLGSFSERMRLALLGKEEHAYGVCLRYDYSRCCSCLVDEELSGREAARA